MKLVRLNSDSASTYSDRASHQLQERFRTNWDVFLHQGLEVFMGSVPCYVKYCIDTITVDKRIRLYPQTEALEDAGGLETADREERLQADDQTLYRAEQANLKSGIKEAKSDYRRRTEQSKNSRQV